MGLFGLFSLKAFDHETFEKELTALTQSISASQKYIQQLKSTQKAFQKTAIIYAVGAYIAIVAFLYLQSPRQAFVPGGKGKVQVFLSSQTQRLVALMVLFPLVAYVVIYVANGLFSMVIRRRERVLAKMKKKHKSKIDELKKITNFNRTNELLNKYGEEKPVQREPEPPKTRKKNINVHNGQQAQLGPFKGTMSGQMPQQGAQLPQKQQQRPPQGRPGNFGPPVKSAPSFLDRILDYIIGSDSNESVENRHALICARCFNHNGLAPPNCKNPFEVTYICPHCGYVNGEISIPGQPANEEGVDTEGEPGIIPEEIHGEKEEPKKRDVSEKTVLMRKAEEKPSPKTRSQVKSLDKTQEEELDRGRGSQESSKKISRKRKSNYQGEKKGRVK